jgi:hypothetical protein
VLLSAGNGTATYRLTSPSAFIVVRATGRCWVEVRARNARGKVTYAGTLLTGQQSSVTGPAWLRLGDPPSVTLTVDGRKIAVPGSTQGVPVNLEFRAP